MKFIDFLKNATLLYAAYSIIDKSIEKRAERMAKKIVKQEKKQFKKGKKNYDSYEYITDDIENRY